MTRLDNVFVFVLVFVLVLALALALAGSETCIRHPMPTQHISCQPPTFRSWCALLTRQWAGHVALAGRQVAGWRWQWQ